MSYQDLSYAGQPPPGSYSGGGYQPGVQQPMSIYPGGQQPVAQGTIDPKIQQWFSTVDSDHSGVISAKELQAALVNGQGKHFSDTACRLMIGIDDISLSKVTAADSMTLYLSKGMFDEDQTGTINLLEFQLLFNYINQWLGTFKSYDQDGSGHIEEKELSQALQQMGYRFSPDFVTFLIKKSDHENHVKISVDQFIVICVQIQQFTEAFRTRDKELKGWATKLGLAKVRNPFSPFLEHTCTNSVLVLCTVMRRFALPVSCQVQFLQKRRLLYLVVRLFERVGGLWGGWEVEADNWGPANKVHLWPSRLLRVGDPELHHSRRKQVITAQLEQDLSSRVI
uniref:EF-hand domain-containing protein n=1 Tax=Timema poppense TaxID=170557 RepID=A0A7R9D863_TIMPO|nr:unnamed protein product [Timema poppensis]